MAIILSNGKTTKQCGNCRYFKTLFKHPSNTGEMKGSINEPAGYICMVPELFENRGGCYYDNSEGICELWTNK